MQEQRRERVLDYILPLLQPYISMPSVCVGMKCYNKQDVEKLLRPMIAMHWRRPAASAPSWRRATAISSTCR